MSKQSFRSRPSVADDLAVHLTKFIETLARAGYAPKTRHDNERLIWHFMRWAQKKGIVTADVDEGRVKAFLACPSPYWLPSPSVERNRGHAALR